MNISKKALMSFIVALTSVVAMAQPYYHIMKEVNGRLIEEKGYDGMDYKIKIDMSETKPKDAIGNKITVTSCSDPTKIRSFWFTNKGNVYYKYSTGKFYFENSQLEYALFPGVAQDHKGHFYFGNTIESCTDPNASWEIKNGEEFYFANPENLPKLQEDLGNERWGVLTNCEWEYVINNLGEYGWKVNGKNCYLIDTTPGKSLLTELRNNNNGNTSDLSIDKFKSLEAQGLVCLPTSGFEEKNDNNHLFIYEMDRYACYWSSTQDSNTRAWYLFFYPTGSGVGKQVRTTRSGMAVRLVILADD